MMAAGSGHATSNIEPEATESERRQNTDPHKGGGAHGETRRKTPNAGKARDPKQQTASARPQTQPKTPKRPQKGTAAEGAAQTRLALAV